MEKDVPKVADDLNQFYLQFDAITIQMMCNIVEVKLISSAEIHAGQLMCARQGQQFQ